MSAVANTSSTTNVKQNMLANKARLAESISDISVTTRIDYNLRFTKQAVLVVANNTEQYSQLASQFLVSLSNERPNSNQVSSKDTPINVAFLSASTKLNDIQIRCRLIEQLFVNALFDPEESLAVSALRFAKQQNEPISIVIDHAHALSLQVKYELSQLVSLAKKNKLTINIVLFGLIEAAQQLSENKSLFKSKMVLIDAETGQVISFDDKKFTREKTSNALGLWQKLSLLGAMLVITAALIWLYLLIVEDINQQAKLTDTQAFQLSDSALSTDSTISIIGDEAIRTMQKKEKVAGLANPQEVVVTKTYSQATSKDVLQALLADNSVKQSNLMPAKAGDVLQALVISDVQIKDEPTTLITEKTPSESQWVEVGSIQASSDEVNLRYYQAKAIEYKQGYVIQIAGFTNVVLSTRFIEQNPGESLHSYQRYLAEKDFTVVTSKVYATKTEAKAALSSLPAQLAERKPWLKPISSVISEINTFKR
jgi:DamX protein